MWEEIGVTFPKPMKAQTPQNQTIDKIRTHSIRSVKQLTALPMYRHRLHIKFRRIAPTACNIYFYTFCQILHVLKNLCGTINLMCTAYKIHAKPTKMHCKWGGSTQNCMQMTNATLFSNQKDLFDLRRFPRFTPQALWHKCLPPHHFHTKYRSRFWYKISIAATHEFRGSSAQVRVSFVRLWHHPTLDVKRKTNQRFCKLCSIFGYREN